MRWREEGSADFNPRPPRGGRLIDFDIPDETGKFQSTPPARGATRTLRTSVRDIWSFQSTPPARGATKRPPQSWCYVEISIHAPREGGDVRQTVQVAELVEISIHAPREGGDKRFAWRLKMDGISIHAPREGGDVTWAGVRRMLKISIHAPREGGDIILHIEQEAGALFQSTPPARGATAAGAVVHDRLPGISIHALREGGDGRGKNRESLLKDFNPRPPRGGRRRWQCVRCLRYPFQSTPPARGATVRIFDNAAGNIISIHAPREGGDHHGSTWDHPMTISIHAPREGGDTHHVLRSAAVDDFNPRPPRGGRLNL